MSLNIDDPRLTAFALGELDGVESTTDRAEMAALVAADAEAARFVAELRRSVVELRAELSREISPGLGDVRRAAILAQGAPAFELVPPPLRLRRDDDVDDAEGRDDVYHVITHPVPEPRRYRTNLIAVAAAVAIVTTMLTLLVSSLFRNFGSWGGLVAVTQPAAAPTVTFAPRPVDRSATTVPDASDAFAGKSPRDLFTVLPDEGPRQPFGVATSISIAPVVRNPTTNPAAGASSAYALSFENPFFEAIRTPVSSFSYNVGTGSLDAVRRAIANHRLPDRASVRIEELINAFTYGYAAPTGDKAFASHIEVAGCPWSPRHRLVRIGLRARDLQQQTDDLVADDLRIRVEFNPAQVTAYRLIGYDRRFVNRGAGDGEPTNQIRSGQAVTALYEVIPFGEKLTATDEPLKYQKPAELTAAAKARKEMLTVKLQYTDIQMDPARFSRDYARQEFAVIDGGKSIEQASDDFKFAAAVASYGLLLRDSPHKGSATYERIYALANEGKRPDTLGDRAKFAELVEQTRQIRG